ncbi:MAG: hypothetical protein WAN93_04050, partial [Solirubrobacteraceae bacterium]
GWGGLAGSLTAKLVVTAVVLLGAGYAALGSRAHGSPPSPQVSSAGVPQSPVGGRALSQALFSTLGAPPRGVRATPRSSVAPVRSSLRTRSAGEATEREFGPERVKGGRAVEQPTSTSSPIRPSHITSRSTREFGIE